MCMDQTTWILQKLVLCADLRTYWQIVDAFVGLRYDFKIESYGTTNGSIDKGSIHLLTNDGVPLVYKIIDPTRPKQIYKIIIVYLPFHTF